MNKQLITPHGGWDDLAISIRYAFSFLFKLSPELQHALAPHRRVLGEDYVVGHIRTGHLEDGISRLGDEELENNLKSIKACVKHIHKPFLVLSGRFVGLL